MVTSRLVAPGVDFPYITTITQDQMGLARQINGTINRVQQELAAHALAINNLPPGNLAQGTNASSGTFWRGDGAWSNAITGPLLLSNGLVSAPALSFATETNSGLYRAAAGDIRLSVLGVDQFRLFNGIASANTLQAGSIGMLPGVGIGGTVTQTTSLTTTVTLNKMSGQVTTVSGAVTAGSAFSFTVNNTFVAATDTVLVTSESASGTAYAVGADVDVGSFKILVVPTATGTFTFVFNYQVFKSTIT